MLLRLLSVTAVALTLVLASGASAATIPYGDCDGGGTVMYLDVTESGTNAPLFNAPACIGNTIDFDPTGFVAEVDPGFGFDSIDGQLNFTIMSKEGSFVEEIVINEQGDYTLLGAEGPDPDTSANVTLTVFLEITFLDTGPTFIQEGPTSFSQTFEVTENFTFGSPWSLQANFVLDDILDTACNNGVTEACNALAIKVDLALDNTLGAFAEEGEVSRITKKDLNGLTITVIPEPQTAVLVVMGLGVMGFVRRRRS